GARIGPAHLAHRHRRPLHRSVHRRVAVGMILSNGDSTGGHQERYGKKARIEPGLPHDRHPLSRTNVRLIICKQFAWMAPLLQGHKCRHARRNCNCLYRATKLETRCQVLSPSKEAHQPPSRSWRTAASSLLASGSRRAATGPSGRAASSESASDCGERVRRRGTATYGSKGTNAGAWLARYVQRRVCSSSYSSSGLGAQGASA